MKNRICILFFTSLISCLLLCACTSKEDVDNRSVFDAAKENFKSQAEEYGEEAEVESDCPIRIISKYGDDLTVEVTKEFFESIRELPDYQARRLTFSDEDYKRLFDVEIEYGAADYTGDLQPADCRIYFGDHSDESKNIFSNPGYSESDGGIQFHFDIEIDGVTIIGAENHPFPEDIASKTAYYTIDNDGELLLAKGACQIKDKYSDVDLAAKESGKAEIESILYTNEEDRARLMPDSDDYRVVIVTFPQVDINTKYITGIDPETGEDYAQTTRDVITKVPATYISVYSYDSVGEIKSIKEKFDFGSEYNAIHNYWTRNYVYYPNDFSDPIDVNDETAVLTCVSDFHVRWMMENYYTGLSVRPYDEPNRELGIDRIGGCYYASYNADALASNFGDNGRGGLSYIANVELGKSLDSYEFNADSADPTGFTSNVKTDYYNCSAPAKDSEVRVYYSQAEKHKGKVYTDDSNTGTSEDGISLEARFYCSYELDSQYFVPASDDYILYYSAYDRETNPTETEHATLVAFDESGNRIQCIQRFIRANNVVNAMSELLPDSGEGTLLYSDDKVFYLDMSTADESYAGNIYDTKDDYLKNTISGKEINLPGYGWTDSAAVFISKE